MWRTRLLNIVTVLSLAAPRNASAQPGVEPTAKNFHKIISLDSMQFRGVGASPDGRWLTVEAGNEIWIMPADGHAKPTRLLSAGYTDKSPIWFPSGERLAFLSDRASRDGSHRTYVMTVAIDPRTGTATSTPRQISTDETPVIGPVSPDGKWVAYIAPNENAWKAVPATGGTARTLLKNMATRPALMWSRDAKTIYFAEGTWGITPPPHGVWYRVSVNGGEETRAYQNAAAMPYFPNTDLHIALVRRSDAEGGGIKRVELYDAKDRMVGSADVTRDMGLYFPRGANGGMYATTSNQRYENSLLTLDGGATRALASSRYAWVNGWADNSTLLIDGKDSVGHFVATLDTAGREGRHVLLPADARWIGWEGVVGYATTFFRGPLPANRSTGSPLYTADARSGAIKLLAPNATWGKGDGDRFLVWIPNGQQVELRAITADGKSSLLRSFAKSDSGKAETAHGDLVAWAVSSNDSVTVFAARGPTGKTHKLITVRSSRHKRFELAWSFDGTTLAVTGESAEPSLSVIHVDEAGAPRGAPVILNPRATKLWSMRWTSDNRSLVLIGIPTGARDGVLMRVPVDPKEAPTFYGRNDEGVTVSPDGKRVAYPAVRTLGTTIWRVDFVPSGKVESR